MSTDDFEEMVWESSLASRGVKGLDEKAYWGIVKSSVTNEEEITDVINSSCSTRAPKTFSSPNNPQLLTQ